SISIFDGLQVPVQRSRSRERYLPCSGRNSLPHRSDGTVLWNIGRCNLCRAIFAKGSRPGRRFDSTSCEIDLSRRRQEVRLHHPGNGWEPMFYNLDWKKQDGSWRLLGRACPPEKRRSGISGLSTSAAIPIFIPVSAV